MVELVQLEKRYADFDRRNVRLLVVSLDDRDDAKKSQAQFPHLTVVADTDRKLISAAQTLHAGAGPGGNDTATPTTFLIDSGGAVRWTFRPDRFLTRLSPEDLLAEVDRHMP